MKIYWIYKYLPAFVFAADWAVSANMGSTTYGPFVFIRPSKTFPTITKEEAEGLREHELQHVRQFYRTVGISSLLYAFSKTWRLKYEVECYKVQLKYVSADVDAFARYISSRYKLDITEEVAKVLLLA